MPTKIRLQRYGKKGQPFYHIVIADGRAPRDGKFIEKIGTYNPLTKPASIELNFDRALYWLQHGAQPTDTTRAILSYKGVIYKNHLLKGVNKGALTIDQAEAKFQNWLKEKENKIKTSANEHQQKIKELNKKRIEEELKINEAKAKIIAEKRAKIENLNNETETSKNEELTEQTVETTINQPAETTIDQPAETTIDQPGETTTDQPAETPDTEQRKEDSEQQEENKTNN